MNALFQRYVFDIQWSDAPPEIIEEAKRIWRDYELGNDTFIHKFSEEDWDDFDYPYPHIRKAIMDTVPPMEEVWIHWWW